MCIIYIIICRWSFFVSWLIAVKDQQTNKITILRMKNTCIKIGEKSNHRPIKESKTCSFTPLLTSGEEIATRGTTCKSEESGLSLTLTDIPVGLSTPVTCLWRHPWHTARAQTLASLILNWSRFIVLLVRESRPRLAGLGRLQNCPEFVLSSETCGHRCGLFVLALPNRCGTGTGTWCSSAFHGLGFEIARRQNLC